MNKRDKIINKIAEVMNAKYSTSEIYLYGSRARNDSKKASDWDLLVLLDEPNVTFEMEINIMDTFYDLELMIGEVFTPLIYSKKEWYENYSLTPLFEKIEMERIRIK